MLMEQGNILAIIVAALAGFMTGGVWYGIFGKPWMKAAGLNEADIKGTGEKKASPLPFILAAFANLLMATMLLFFIQKLPAVYLEAPALIRAISVSLLVWLGFVVTTLSVNNAFQMKPFLLTLIDAGHWFAVLLVIGAVLGLMGM